MTGCIVVTMNNVYAIATRRVAIVFKKAETGTANLFQRPGMTGALK
jgi:hypothetical protein